MKKQLAPTCKFIYVHGTNGSGKSTLARALIVAAGGATGVSHISSNKKATWTHTATDGLSLVGKYGTACGGVDGLTPYASIFDVVASNACMERSMFAEGLVTPGVDTCKTLAGAFGDHLFIFLDTPLDTCIANVLKRRGRKGTTKEYDPKNLYRKHQSASNWIKRLEAAGLNTASLSWDNAYERILQEFNLPQPTIKELL